MSAKAARHLRVIDGHGEVFEPGSPEETIRALEAALTRAQRTIDALRADKAAERKGYIRRALIEDAFADWQEAGRGRPEGQGQVQAVR
jgi:flavin-binding protein dodecin